MAEPEANLGPDQNPRQGVGAFSDTTNRAADQGEGSRASGRWTSTPAHRSTGWSAYSPFTLMRRMAEDMDRIFDDYGMHHGHWTGHPSYQGGSSIEPWRAENGSTLTTWAPEVEVFQRGDKIIVRADLPGMKKDDVKVDIENNVLTISGERFDEKTEDRKDLYRSERSYGSFFRAIPLPDGTDAEHCDASFKDGVLEVTLKGPKLPENTKKSIAIK